MLRAYTFDRYVLINKNLIIVDVIEIKGVYIFKNKGVSKNEKK